MTDTADDAQRDVRKPRSRFAGALRPLALRPYRLMWLGSTTSSLGDAVVQIALVFAVLHIGGTATDIGLIAALQTVARVVFLLAGGVWADRLRRQDVMMALEPSVIAEFADGLDEIVVVEDKRPFIEDAVKLLLTGRAHVWEIAVGAVLYGIGASFFGPASTGLTPETVPADQLQQANSLLDLPQSLFSVGGPAVGGVLIAVFGTGWLFAFDAASFVVSVICLAMLRAAGRPAVRCWRPRASARSSSPGRSGRRLRTPARDPAVVLDQPDRARVLELRDARHARARPRHRGAVARRGHRLGADLGLVRGGGGGGRPVRAAGQAAAAARGREPAAHPGRAAAAGAGVLPLGAADLRGQRA